MGRGLRQVSPMPRPSSWENKMLGPDCQHELRLVSVQEYIPFLHIHYLLLKPENLQSVGSFFSICEHCLLECKYSFSETVQAINSLTWVK